MFHPLNLSAALLIAIILGTAWQLEEPMETEVMEVVSKNKQAVQTDKLVLPGKPSKAALTTPFDPE